jgi:hypothetical protein
VTASGITRQGTISSVPMAVFASFGCGGAGVYPQAMISAAPTASAIRKMFPVLWALRKRSRTIQILSTSNLNIQKQNICLLYQTFYNLNLFPNFTSKKFA